MQIACAAAIILILLQNSNGAILIPEELPTIASLAYSLLPPIKLGQDSRFGVGFRLGRNADTQILLELGPQTDTATLGDMTGKRKSKSSDPALSHREERLRKWMEIIKRGLNSDSSKYVVANNKNNTLSSTI